MKDGMDPAMIAETNNIRGVVLSIKYLLNEVTATQPLIKDEDDEVFPGEGIWPVMARYEVPVRTGGC